MSQLIILGNGFDLRCGLKSSYKDFFESIKQEIENYLSNPNNTFSNKPVYFWEELWFNYYKKHNETDITWYNIENIIKETLWHINFGEGSAADPKNSNGLWYNGWSCYYKRELPYGKFEYEKDLVKKHLLTYCAKFFCYNMPNMIVDSDNEKKYLLNTNLLSELKKFERRFCQYIKDNIFNPKEKTRNNEYLLDAVNLLLKINDSTSEQFNSIDDIFKDQIIKKNIRTMNYDNSPNRFNNVIIDEKTGKKTTELVEIFQTLKDTSILSFNYTALFDILKVESPCLYNNVHGKLCMQQCEPNCTSSNVIFGIDDTVIQSQNANDELRLFSKTYRKMLDINTPTKTLPLNNGEPVTIKFYGHSLGDADYSYFQSIFDYYNLYQNTNVDLIFYYTKPYQQTDAIYRLINVYGKTLTNQNQGKNLMHKLLLENRIKIVEISLNK